MAKIKKIVKGSNAQIYEVALSKAVLVRLTPEQHERWRAIGGSKWVRGLLEKNAKKC